MIWNRALASRIISLGLLCTFQALLFAQTGTAPAGSNQPVEACKLPKGRDVLLKLMDCCKRSLASDKGCREYDAKNRYVIIKDNAATKPEAYLIIPTEKITGIEDRHIFKAPYLNIWANGWDQSDRNPGWGDRRIGLAINSAHARTQDQLHIHISCINPAVAQTLDSRETEKASSYSVQLPPSNNTYTVTTLNDLTDNESPFAVAQKIPGVKGHMGDQSVAVVKSKEPGRYYVLVNAYKDGKGGSAEELLDQTCAVK